MYVMYYIMIKIRSSFCKGDYSEIFFELLSSYFETEGSNLLSKMIPVFETSLFLSLEAKKFNA